MNNIIVGDFVKGVSKNREYINTDMTKGLVVSVFGERIKIRIIEHKKYTGGAFEVDAVDCEKIGHVKPFDKIELLELLKNGCKKAALDYDLRGANLYDANLCGANLYDANLRGANLRGADLRGANLYDANLCGANLCGADLRGADLRGADLRGANLYDANLRDADLRGANLYDANLCGADLRDADLRGADLRDANLYDADLRGANLRGADLRGADIDFSCWPLWCGGLKVKTDARQAAQLAYHFCSIQCEDEEYIKMRNSILGFANKFHRVEECGKLEPIEIKEEK